MKILIIGSSKATPTEQERSYYQQYVDFFVQSAQFTEGETVISTALMDDLLIQVGEGELSIYDTFNKSQLSDYDAFFFRGDKFRAHMDVIATINEYAKHHGIKTVNTYDNVRDPSKLLQAVYFEIIGVPVAKTLNVNSALLNNFDLVEGWEFPCIMKAKQGSHGNDNYVVTSLDEVREISLKDTEKYFVLQRFVPNDGDYRILIIGDETIVIGRSAQEGSHLNNTSQGGEATEVSVDSLPKEVIEQSHAIAQYFKMTIAGVDALQDKVTKKFYFLEVNSQPQLMTGAFTDKKSQLLGTLFEKIGTKQ